jgi:hypothetical protein
MRCSTEGRPWQASSFFFFTRHRGSGIGSFTRAFSPYLRRSRNQGLGMNDITVCSVSVGGQVLETP